MTTSLLGMESRRSKKGNTSLLGDSARDYQGRVGFSEYVVGDMYIRYQDACL